MRVDFDELLYLMKQLDETVDSKIKSGDVEIVDFLMKIRKSFWNMTQDMRELIRQNQAALNSLAFGEADEERN